MVISITSAVKKAKASIETESIRELTERVATLEADLSKLRAEFSIFKKTVKSTNVGLGNKYMQSRFWDCKLLYLQ